jgi:hypothetical protein
MIKERAGKYLRQMEHVSGPTTLHITKHVYLLQYGEASWVLRYMDPRAFDLSA